MWLFVLFTAALVSSTSCTLTSARTQTVGDKTEQIPEVAPEFAVLQGNTFSWSKAERRNVSMRWSASAGHR
jgi:hypothetical protein